MGWVKPLSVLVLLGFFLYIALSPAIVYAPVPKLTLFFLIGIFAAGWLGGEAVARLKLSAPGFALTAGGSAAVVFGLLIVLDHLVKPEEQIAVYHVFDEEGNKLSLDWDGALEVESQGNVDVGSYKDGHTLVIIFPEQVPKAIVRVKKAPRGRSYEGELSYGGNRKYRLKLGEDLK